MEYQRLARSGFIPLGRVLGCTEVDLSTQQSNCWCSRQVCHLQLSLMLNPCSAMRRMMQISTHPTDVALNCSGCQKGQMRTPSGPFLTAEDKMCLFFNLVCHAAESRGTRHRGVQARMQPIFALTLLTLFRKELSKLIVKASPGIAMIMRSTVDV